MCLFQLGFLFAVTVICTTQLKAMTESTSTDELLKELLATVNSLKKDVDELKAKDNGPRNVDVMVTREMKVTMVTSLRIVMAISWMLARERAMVLMPPSLHYPWKARLSWKLYLRLMPKLQRLEEADRQIQ